MHKSKFYFFKLAWISRFFILGFFIIPSLFTLADRVRKDWNPVSNTSFYEYEVSDTPYFSSNSLIRQGSSPDPFFNTDLRAGLYFFRYRALDSQGKPSPWSPTQKILIKGAAQLSFHTPLQGEIIDLPESKSASTYFEWSTIPGATEYELKLFSISNNRNVSKTSTVPSISVEDLGGGQWSARVIAKSNGQIFSESKEMNFQVQTRPLPKPQFQFPREGDQFPAWELIRVRWLRKVGGEKSEVSVFSLSEKSRQLISRESVYEQNSTWIQGLDPGRYQVTVKTFINDTPKYVEESASFSVEIDPFGQKSKRLGIRMLLSPVAVGLGVSSTESALTTHADSGVVRSKTPIIKAGDVRMFVPLAGNLDLNVRFQSELSDSENLLTEPSNFTSSQSRFHLSLGPSLRRTPLGPTKPVTYSLLIGLNRYHLFSDSKSTSSYFDFLSLMPEISIIYAGWNSRYSIEARVLSEIPVLVAQGQTLGSGNIRPLPSFSAEGLLKRKLSDSIKGFYGGEVVFQKIISSESKVPAGLTQAIDTHINDFLIYLKMGIDWEF